MRERIEQMTNHSILKSDFVAKCFMLLVEDDSLNGAIMKVTSEDDVVLSD